MKIAFLKPVGLDFKHIRPLLDYLLSKGVEVKEIQLHPERVEDTMNELLEFKPQFTLDINGTGIIMINKEGKKIPLHDELGFVHFSFFTEDPLLYFPQFIENGEEIKHRNLIAIVTDMKHIESLQILGITNITYMTPFVDFNVFPEPQKEREISISFLGPVVDPQIFIGAVRQNLPEEAFPVFLETGEFMFRNPEVSPLTAITHVVSLLNPEFQNKFSQWRNQNKEAFLRLINDAAMYATMRKRWYLINFLDGVNLKIIGDFQGEMREDHENIRVNSYEELLNIYGDTNVTIITFPRSLPTGIGYTPIEVSAMGSAPMMDFKSTVTSILSPQDEFIPFMPLDRADIEEKVIHYLENPEEARKIGEKAKSSVKDKFKVEDRGEFLYKMMEDIISKAPKNQEENQEQSKT